MGLLWAEFNYPICWQQRNRIKAGDSELMLTVPVANHGKRDQLLNEVLIDAPNVFSRKHLRSIQQCYAKADCFDKYFAELGAILTSSFALLADLNIEIISWIKNVFLINADLICSSELSACGVREDYLLSICKTLFCY